MARSLLVAALLLTSCKAVELDPTEFECLNASVCDSGVAPRDDASQVADLGSVSDAMGADAGEDATFEDAGGEDGGAPGDAASTDANEHADAMAYADANGSADAMVHADAAVQTDAARPPVQGRIECTPTELDFGAVNPGACTQKLTTCTNTGDTARTVTHWRLAAGPPTSPDFSPEPFIGVTTVLAGQSGTVSVEYCPSGLGGDEATLRIVTDHPTTRNVDVRLVGSGGGPDVDVTPTAIDFGQVSLIAPARRNVMVSNLGYAPLEITRVHATSSIITTNGASAMVIPAGGFMIFVVEVQPTMSGPFMASVLIETNDADEPVVTVEVSGTGINLPPCSYSVLPAVADFGVVMRGRVARRTIEVRNSGTSDCLLGGAALLAGSDPSLSLHDAPTQSRIIGASAATTIAVEWRPSVLGSLSGQVQVSLSSPTTPTTNIDFAGEAVDASPFAAPSDVDFGTIGLMCSARDRTVRLHNGSNPITISDFRIHGANSAFTLNTLPDHLTLVAHETVALTVGHQAGLVSEAAGWIEMDYAELGQGKTLVINLEGEGASAATQVDTYTQLGRSAADVLFIVDDSGSMAEEQQGLSMASGAFLQFATAQQIDYQIGVTTTDVDEGMPPEAGRLVPLAPMANRVVTAASMPSPASHMQAIINVGIDNWTFTEKGLAAFEYALAPDVLFGHNAGFVRPDALLSVVLLSDEDDSSTRPTAYYVDVLRSVKGWRDSSAVTFSAITGDAPSGCSGGGGSAQAGLRYVDVAEALGGVFQSICTADWNRAVEDLSTTALGFRSKFALTQPPVMGTVRVFVDGTEVAAAAGTGTVNWSYAADANSVHFSPFATPQPGAAIRIEYTAECL